MVNALLLSLEAENNNALVNRTLNVEKGNISVLKGW
jgi:hypothetical protein